MPRLGDPISVHELIELLKSYPDPSQPVYVLDTVEGFRRPIISAHKESPADAEYGCYIEAAATERIPLRRTQPGRQGAQRYADQGLDRGVPPEDDEPPRRKGLFGGGRRR